MSGANEPGHIAAQEVRDVPPAPAATSFVRRWVTALVRPVRSLSGRITIVVACGTLVIMGAAQVMHVRLVNDAMRPEIGKQLLASVARAADDVDGRIERRARALEAVVLELVTRPRQLTPAAARDFLDTHTVLLTLFEHVMLVGADGHVLADRPRVAGVLGADLNDRDYFKRARDTRRLAISAPSQSRFGDFQFVAMALPIFAPDGRFSGAIVGSMNLITSGLFAEISDARIGETGYFAAYSLTGTIIMHPDRRRILKPMPSKDEAPALHRALAGWSGWNEGAVEGFPALTAYKRLRHVPWVLTAVQPSDEALEPLAKVEKVLLSARAAAILLLAVLVGVVAARALQPLARLREQIDDLESGCRTGDVDTNGPHEIAVVARAFNRLNGKRQALSEALAQREAFHRALNEQSPVGVFLIDAEGRLTYCNGRFENMLGRSFERLRGLAWLESIHREDRPAARDRWVAARRARDNFTLEFRVVQPGGGLLRTRVKHQAMGSPTRPPEYLAVALDVTAEHEAADRLRSERQQGQMILEAISDALVVVAANGRVRDMTRAAEALTGWARDKANGTPIGRVVRVYDTSDAPVDLAEVIADTHFRTEAWTCEKANGERIAVEVVWQCFADAYSSGGVLVLRDITDRRREAERIAWAAAHDPLTGLENRRSFDESLRTAHADLLRTGTGAAVVMVDLDHFKQVNDRGGHEAGDEMLRLVTRVLREAVRATDVAARVGGDEFALLMRGCTVARASMVAETIRNEIALLSVARGGVHLRIGSSFGIAVLEPTDADWTGVMQRADAACYEAKKEGRNAIRIAGASPAFTAAAESDGGCATIEDEACASGRT